MFRVVLLSATRRQKSAGHWLLFCPTIGYFNFTWLTNTSYSKEIPCTLIALFSVYSILCIIEVNYHLNTYICTIPRAWHQCDTRCSVWPVGYLSTWIAINNSVMQGYVLWVISIFAISLSRGVSQIINHNVYYVVNRNASMSNLQRGYGEFILGYCFYIL